MRPTQIHKLLHSKGNHKQKWNHKQNNLQTGRKIFANHVTYQGLTSKIFKQLIQLHIKNKQSSKKWAAVAAATAKLLQLCPTLCDPRDGSPLGSPVPGVSRQEHWSGLPFPSPMQCKWNWSHSVMSDCSQPHGLQPTRLPRPRDLPGKSTRMTIK